MRIQSAPPAEWRATLAQLTQALAVAAPTDVPGVLTLVWEGLLAARWCGLAVAADPRWTSRQGNAESVEHDLATQLSWSDTLDGRDLTLPSRHAAVLALDGEAADSAVATIIAFSAVTHPLLLAAAGTASAVWEDRRTCQASVSLARALGECWQGLHPSYTHRPAPRR